MSNEATNIYAQFKDNAGVPLDNGSIAFNINLTPNLGTIFSNEALTIAQDNPYTLDSSGRITGDVKFVGKMRMVIRDKTGGHVRTLDNIVSSTDSVFPGDEPDLVDTDTALITGSSIPDTEQHIEYGSQSIQSKSDKTTASALKLNNLGAGAEIDGVKILGQALSGWTGSVFHDLEINTQIPGLVTTIGGGSIGSKLVIDGSNVEFTNATFPAFRILGTVAQATHPTATTTYSRALTLPDLNFTPVNNTDTSLTPTVSQIYKNTRFTAAGLITITIDDDTETGMTLGDVFIMTFLGAAGGALTIDGGASTVVNGMPATIAQFKKASFQLVGDNEFDYTGPA